jgi:hypothetical protein
VHKEYDPTYKFTKQKAFIMSLEISSPVVFWTLTGKDKEGTYGVMKFF